MSVWWPVGVAVLLALPGAGLLFHVTFGYVRYWLYWRHKGLGPPMSFRDMLAYQTRETGASLIIGWWWIRGAFRHGLRLPKGEVTGRPVMCVHGWSQNGSNFWGMRLALEAHGRPTRAVFMGWLFRPVRGYVPALAHGMRELIEEFPDGIDVIAHSMGGIVLRAVLAEHPDLAAKVHRIITVGSPHEGTAAARGFLKQLEPGARDLSRRSGFVSELPPFSESAPHALVTCVAARHDWIVYPRETSLLEGTQHVVVEGVGHVGLLTWQHAIDSVVEALMAPEWVQEREEQVAQSLGAASPLGDTLSA